MVYCRSCGYENSDDAIFCSNCGEILKESSLNSRENAYYESSTGYNDYLEEPYYDNSSSYSASIKDRFLDNKDEFRRNRRMNRRDFYEESDYHNQEDQPLQRNKPQAVHDNENLGEIDRFMNKWFEFDVLIFASLINIILFFILDKFLPIISMVISFYIGLMYLIIKTHRKATLILSVPLFFLCFGAIKLLLSL